MLALSWLGTAVAGGREVVRLDPPSRWVVTAAHAATVRLSFVVKDGYHVQANPASADYLRPVVVVLTGDCGIAPGKPQYPAAEAYRLQGADSDLATYSGRFTVTFTAAAATSKLERGDCLLRGTLEYQACDARTCLAPATLAFTVPVTVQ